MPNQKPVKKIAIRVRVVPIETAYGVIRRSLRKLDAAIAAYQKKTITKVAIDRAYDEFTDAMRKPGLSKK